MTAVPAAGYFEDPTRTNLQAKQAQDDMLSVFRELLGGDSAQAVTLAADSFTPIRAIAILDTEGGAAADTLSIIAQTSHPDGRLLLLRTADANRDITIQHGAGGIGQILLGDAANLVLDDPSQWLMLRRNGTTWEEVLRSYGAKKLAARTALGLGTVTQQNALINPGMQIAENPSAALSANWIWTPCNRWAAVAYAAANVSAGTLQTGTGSAWRSGNAVGARGVTTINAGSTIGLRQKVESAIAQRFRTRRASITATVFHTAGSAIDFGFSLYAPTAVDNFATLSAPLASPHTSVQSGAATTVTWEDVDLSGLAAGNGLMLELDAFVNVAAAGFDVLIGDVGLAEGSRALPAEILDPAAEHLRCQRYLYQLGGYSGGNFEFLAQGACTSTSQAAFEMQFPVLMRATPTFSISAPADFNVSDNLVNATPTALALTGATNNSRRKCQVLATTPATLTSGRGATLSAASTAAARLKFDADFGP